MWVNSYHNNILSTHIFSTGNNDAAMHVNGAGADSPETQAHYVIINNNFVNTGEGYASTQMLLTLLINLKIIIIFHLLLNICVVGVRIRLAQHLQPGNH